MTSYPKDFEEQVKTCLSNLYDQGKLTQQQLLHELLPNMESLKRTQAFRQLIIDIVKSLRPEHDTRIASKPYRRYLILQQRYVEEQQHSEIIPQLAISERQYYREHQDTIQSVAQILWERLNSYKNFSVQSEAQRIYHDSKADVVDIEALFDGIANAIQPSAEHYNVRIKLPSYFPDAHLRTNHDILRQLIIWIVSRLLEQQLDGFNILSITCNLNGSHYEFHFFPISDVYKPMETIQTFLKLLNATIVHKNEMLVLSLPIDEQTILLIDDNPDTPVLFRRLLVNTPYQLMFASEAKQGLVMAQNTNPSVILLDIMMPNHDGWEVLHSLKNQAQTSHIPVVVCTVLQIEDMALSSGADAYLHKPPSENELIELLAYWESVSDQQ